MKKHTTIRVFLALAICLGFSPAFTQAFFPKYEIGVQTGMSANLKSARASYSFVAAGLSPSFNSNIGQVDLQLAYRLHSNIALYFSLGGGQFREQFILDVTTPQAWLATSPLPRNIRQVYHPNSFAALGTGAKFGLFMRGRSRLILNAGCQARWTNQGIKNTPYYAVNLDAPQSKVELGSITTHSGQNLHWVGLAGIEYGIQVRPDLRVGLGALGNFAGRTGWNTNVNLSYNDEAILTASNEGNTNLLYWYLTASYGFGGNK